MESWSSSFWESQLSRAMFQSINVWVNVCDRDLNILVWNPTAERISGYTSEEVIGHTGVWEWLYPDEQIRTELTGLSSELLTHDTALSNVTSEIFCKNKQRKIIAWYSRPLIDENNQTVMGFVTFGYDVTEQKRAEAALQKAHTDLQILYKIASITTEFTNLSHILEGSLEQVLSITDAKTGSIHLWNPGLERLEMRVNRGMVESEFEQYWRGQHFDRNQLVSVPLSDTPHAQLISVPMFAKGDFQGVISLVLSHNASKSENSIELLQSIAPQLEDRIDLLRSIADQIGIAVDNARLYQQSRQLAVVEERQRLARDLHDSVSQSLYSVALFAEASQQLLHGDDMERVEQYLDRLTTTATRTLKEMRLLLFELRPLDLRTLTLPELIQQRLEAVERRSGIKSSFRASALPALPHAVEKHLYYVTIEALNNALKHANCDTVIVHLEVAADTLQLEVRDNGSGFNWNAAKEMGGMGLKNMQDRVNELGGTIDLQPNVNAGTGSVLSVSVPIKTVGTLDE